MPKSMTELARYLLAKRTVDDRALNRRVWERLRSELGELRRPTVDVIEIGAGIGTGAERMTEWRLVEPLTRIRYTAVEPADDLLEKARSRRISLPFECRFALADLQSFAAMPENHGRFDLVVAHAVLDIVDLPPSLDALLRLARPGALLYLPITFDGETIFEPAHEGDETVLSAYHDTMEEKGSSRTGRRLFHTLRLRSAEVLEAGSSDWIVHPVDGNYLADERFFLEFLLRTIEGAVRDRVEGLVLDAWIAERRTELARAELLYCAHQWDLLARRPL
jgi:hypothetical protein